MGLMNWWIVGVVAAAGFVLWGVVVIVLERRAGMLRAHYSDGCAKPFFDRAFRADGSRTNIIPRPGDGEVGDLEHLLEHTS
jgi:hypothetical protein